MKRKSPARLAFLSSRALFGIFLCCAGIFLSLFASDASAKSWRQAHANSQAAAVGNVIVAGSTGADGNYPTLKTAFDAINANATQTGNNITVTIAGDTDEGLSSAVLNQPSGGSWTTLMITPVGTRTVTGATTAGLPLIDLNGADNVTINGLNASGNSLTISNTTADSTAETSTIRFINGASNNTVTNCTVLGSSTTPLATAGGTILFSTSTGGANTGNSVSNNNIGPASAGPPTKAVTSLGSASPDNNTLNVIDNNNIFDFFRPANTAFPVAGISLQANTTTVTVSNNRLYQTASRTVTLGGPRYVGITADIGTGDGSATITGNTIGFGAADGTGTTAISGGTNVFSGIFFTSASTATPTSIQGNTISGISQSSAGNSVVGFNGIYVGTGRYDIGTVTGNKIGSLDGSSTITLTYSSNAAVYVMRDESRSSNSISNNQIGAITINGTGTGTNGFVGILLDQFDNTVTATLNNNQIGGSGAGGITDTLVGNYTMYGIWNFGASLNATGNTIQNFTGNSNSSSPAASGMYLSVSGPGASVISQNVIHSLTNNSGAAASSIWGIFCNFPPAANVVERNFVHSLSITSSNAGSQLIGILSASGPTTYKNNMVQMGVDASGADITAGYKVYGMFDTATENSLYNNTAYIGGSNVVSSSNTFAFASEYVTNGTRTYEDNIFWNARSNASGAGKNYAIAMAGAGGATSNFNDLFANGTGGFVGLLAGADQPTLSDWRTATGLDANSVSVNPQLVTPNGTAATVDLHLSSDASPVANIATPLAAVTNDFDNDPRSATIPDTGADEIPTTASPTPTPTATSTPTSTPMSTPTATATATATASATATATASPSPTATATATATPTVAPAQSLNLSSRLRVETGDKLMIGGFIVTGNTPKKVAIRGMGPFLASFGITDFLQDPFLELRSSNNALLQSNDNWKATQQTEIESIGLAPNDDREAVIVTTLAPGTYTALLTGKDGTTGVGLVEVYDVNPTADSQLGNLSTRGFVNGGNDVLIAGFVLGGSNTGNDRVAIRGLGPSLAQFGLNPVLADPTLELHDRNGATLITNDDWATDPVSAANLALFNLQPGDPKESAIFTSLPPGTFTAILAGKNGGSGIGIVEVYNLK